MRVKSVRIQHKAHINSVKNHLPTDWGQSSVVLTCYAEGHTSNHKNPNLTRYAASIEIEATHDSYSYVSSGKCIASNACVRKEDSSYEQVKVRYLKTRTQKPQVSTQKEMIKIRGEIDEVESRKYIPGLCHYFFAKINKFDKLED